MHPPKYQVAYSISGAMDQESMKKFGYAPLSEMRVLIAGQQVHGIIKAKEGQKAQSIAHCLTTSDSW